MARKQARESLPGLKPTAAKVFWELTFRALGIGVKPTLAAQPDIPSQPANSSWKTPAAPTYS
jgi:hypothetical protein